MINLPLVSVIVPIFNTEKYISRTLYSLINQTYTNIEIICIDDGSTDNSLETAQIIEKIDSRIKVYTQINRGVVTARNNAIDKSVGEYILPLDSDDLLAPDCIYELVKTILTKKCDVAVPKVIAFGDNLLNFKYNLPRPTPFNMKMHNCCVNAGLFEKKLWKKYKGYDQTFDKGLEDYDFWLNFICDNKKIVRCQSAIFYYRLKSITESRNASVFNNTLLEQELFSKIKLKHNISNNRLSYKIHRYYFKFIHFFYRSQYDYINGKTNYRILKIFKYTKKIFPNLNY